MPRNAACRDRRRVTAGPLLHMAESTERDGQRPHTVRDLDPRSLTQFILCAVVFVILSCPYPLPRRIAIPPSTMLSILLSLLVLPPTALGGVQLHSRAAQSIAVCTQQFAWMDNSKNISPCQVAASLDALCNNGSTPPPCLKRGHRSSKHE
jgi:hypothetical protein